MSAGSHHYAQAERLLEQAEKMATLNGERLAAGTCDEVLTVGIAAWQATVATAQVHATLAAAAAAPYGSSVITGAFL